MGEAAEGSKFRSWPITGSAFPSDFSTCGSLGRFTLFLLRRYFCPPTFYIRATTRSPATTQVLADHHIMSFSSLVSDLTFRDQVRPELVSQLSRAKSYASTAATSVSIAGDISSQLHGGYSHPLARAWQAERQLTKVRRLLVDL